MAWCGSVFGLSHWRVLTNRTLTRSNKPTKITRANDIGCWSRNQIAKKKKKHIHNRIDILKHNVNYFHPFMIILFKYRHVDWKNNDKCLFRTSIQFMYIQVMYHNLDRYVLYQCSTPQYKCHKGCVLLFFVCAYNNNLKNVYLNLFSLHIGIPIKINVLHANTLLAK